MTGRRKRWPQGAWMNLTSADTLKALMDQREFSYERMARYAGCSKSFISHLVKGRKKSCSPLLAENIAEALQVPLEILFAPNMSTTSSQSVGAMRKAG